MLGWRIFISTILIPALIVIFWLDARIGASAPCLLGLCLLLALRGVWEFAALLRVGSFEPNFGWTSACSLGIVLAGWGNRLGAETPPIASPEQWIGVAYALAVLILFLKGAVTYREPGKALGTLGAELLIVSYIGVLLAVTAQLRWVATPAAGYLALGSLIAAAKCGDIGAYSIGRALGKRKMAPRLSPGKTWAGAWGALGGAGLGGWLWLQFATPVFNSAWSPPRWYWSVLFGVTIGLVGLIGDLCESLIKRDVGAKDSAALLPGFGGLLDLIDSILYAGPIAYLLWRVLPLATWL